MKLAAYDEGDKNFNVKSLFPILFSIAVYDFEDWKVASNDALWFEVLEIMDWLKLTEEERNIVWMRIQDYTLQEIADELGYSRMWPSLVMKDIKKRFMKKNKYERLFPARLERKKKNGKT